MKRMTLALLVAAVGAAGWFAAQRNAATRRNSIAFAAEPSDSPQPQPESLDPKMVVAPKSNVDPKMIVTMPNVDPKMAIAPPTPRASQNGGPGTPTEH